MKKNAKTILTPEKALARMQTLCAKSEQCSFDIAQKLKRAGLSGADIKQTIASLTASRFIDDPRYARAFAADKVRFSHWGRRKISFALRLKKISPELIENAFEAVPESDYTKAVMAAASAKSRDMDRPFSPADKAKIFRFLASRGFETEYITSALEALNQT